VEAADQIGRAWDRALTADRPVLLEAVTDPDVPPLPPHITLEEARHFASSIVEGDEDTAGMITQTIKNVAAKWLPTRSS
jgi:pyruvate dehydrogenase (quinone)